MCNQKIDKFCAMAPPPSAPERASQVWAWPSMTGFGPVAATASSVAIAAVMVAALLADGLRTGTIGLQAPWLALSDLMYMCCFFAVAQWLLLASWSSGYRLTSVAARPQFDSSRLRSCVPAFLRSSSPRFLVSLVETRRHLLLAHLSFFGQKGLVLVHAERTWRTRCRRAAPRAHRLTPCT